MGFSYRKSLKMGPFRVTASKSGISYSAGVKGARVTKRANGKVQTTLSAPGTGLRYTTKPGTKTRQAKRPAAGTRPSARRSAPAPKAASRPSPVVAPNAVSPPKPPRARRQARELKSAPAPKPARARKPVRLRGERSTTPARIPPTRLLPFTISGNLATVTIYQGGIHVERTRAGRINGNHSADIPWQELAGIDFLKPNFFRNGHVHFATFDDPRGLTSTGNGNRMAASGRNPHAVLFAWHQSRAYKKLRDLLTEGSTVPPPPHQPPVRQPPTWQPSGWPPQQPPSTRG
jgi:Protein of unknown function (DUF4236)